MNDFSAPASKKKLPVWVIFAALVLLLGLLIFLAMGLAKKQQPTLTPGSRVQDFSLTTFDNQTINSKDMQGKVVLLNFWASWCTTCTDEAAILEEAWQKADKEGKVVFVGVDYADTDAAARAFIEKYAITYANGPDLRSEISQQFHISGVPETYLIGSDGTLLGIKIGPFSSVDEVSTFIDVK
jgi:cytochrome c biogenesis protein CcmG, thiol:disulfide interchange protein DsbE